jgi:hypothetical protein
MTTKAVLGTVKAACGYDLSSQAGVNLIQELHSATTVASAKFGDAGAFDFVNLFLRVSGMEEPKFLVTSMGYGEGRLGQPMLHYRGSSVGEALNAAKTARSQIEASGIPLNAATTEGLPLGPEWKSVSDAAIRAASERVIASAGRVVL